MEYLLTWKDTVVKNIVNERLILLEQLDGLHQYFLFT